MSAGDAQPAPGKPTARSEAIAYQREVTINEDGAVYSIRFLDCPESLKQAVRAAVCQWRYEPTYLYESISHEGRRVAVVAVIELSYTFARYRV